MNFFGVKFLCLHLIFVLPAACVASFSQEVGPQTSGGDLSVQAMPSAASESTPQPRTDWLDISFSTRVRYETVDHRFKLGEDPSDQQLPLRTRIGVGIKEITYPFRFLLEFEDSRVYLNDSQSTVNVTMRDEHDVLQAYIALDFNRKAGDGPRHTLYAGRQSFDLGSRRLFARNRYRNTTNHYDGLRFTTAVAKKWSLDTFFLGPLQMEMNALDRPAKGTYIWGGYFALSPKFADTWDIYYFGFWRNPPDSNAVKRRYSTLGIRLFRENRPLKLGYEVESAWQFGKVGNLHHFAHFQHLQLGYTFNVPWQPSVTGMYDYASGDCDPSDDKSGTFDYLYGARRWEYGPTGILNWMYRSNINSPAIFVGLKPTKKLEFLPMLRWLWLAQARAPWVGSGLVDASGVSGTSIGKTLDLRFRYNIVSYFRPEFGYVRFFKGTYAARVPGSPTALDSNYFYVDLELRFDDLYQR